MLLSVSKKNIKKCKFYLEKMKPVKEDDKSYYFLQDEARIITLEWRMAK